MQVPDLHVWYGPDTYMGRNLELLFETLAALPDSFVQELHPAHTAESVRDCLPRLHCFQHGTCMVHEIFGGETCSLVRQGYSDAYITAHFEVPGEMFMLALEAQRERGMGVTGSTSNILNFIRDKVRDAAARGFRDRLQFVLGTESGMITSIVRAVQTLLWQAGPAAELIEIEIVFPVAADAISTGGDSAAYLPGGLAVVPGPAGGEGCSSEGGCAACPYMKMNSLDALMTVCERVGTEGKATLAAYQPRQYAEQVSHSCLGSLKRCCHELFDSKRFAAMHRSSAAFVVLRIDIVSRVIFA
jgi:quinolinate synthase